MDYPVSITNVKFIAAKATTTTQNKKKCYNDIDAHDNGRTDARVNVLTSKRRRTQLAHTVSHLCGERIAF